MNPQQRIASFGLTIAILLIGVSQLASAQSSYPTCVLASYQWSYNSQGQSPCEVATELLGVCAGGSYTLDPLKTPGMLYLGPTLSDQNPCQCSSVSYSMVSACGLCQNASQLAWSEWTTNCATEYTDVFPEPIPQGTRVPGWAFLDVEANDGFDAAVAKQDANATESTALPIPSSTSSPLHSSTASPSSVTASTATSASDSSASDEARSNAIGGGVVGGLAGLTAILVLVLYLYIRRRRSKSKATSMEAPPISPDEEKQVSEQVIDPPTALSFYQHSAPFSSTRSSDVTMSRASERSLVPVQEEG